MSQISELQKNIENGFKTLEIEQKNSELQKLKEESSQPDFWKDNKKAVKTMQQIDKLSEIIEPWITLQKDLDELEELIKLGDDSLKSDIDSQLSKLEKEYTKLLKQLRFSGKYDNSNVILSIFAGAGGTDAQDWVGMLLRMYVRWAEHNKLKVEMIDESPGEEAGLKSVSMKISGGSYLYGKLRGEDGVHRLVRQSPFNADAKRQTSFAKVEIIPEIDEPLDAPIDDKDLKIDVFRSGGRGGQSVNTTDSAVRITHTPTGIVVSIQNERSQIQK